TGLALVYSAQGRKVVAHEVTYVTFAKLDRVEIDAYVASGSPLDKAGAYGIQEDLGATFVSAVNGDYYTVVGLPLHRLYRMLRDDFGDLLVIDGKV
ncbi:MAG: Maf family protein, partial [Rhodothermales bacterium]|nr:Maf family protein [Rhodothermales bacterium]